MEKILKILVLIAIIIIAPKIAFAALHADTVWELRASATANNVNGGGFNPSNATPGTDYSQQDAAQDSGADLASANGTTNPCVITSASHNFVDADEGNIIHITAGTSWLAGWYEIVSTAGNAATLDRACGSSASISSGTWYLGGALSMNSTLDDDFFEQTVAGNAIWVKDGNYTLGESVSVSNAGTAAAPIKISGYYATRGDNPTGENRPNIDAGSGQLVLGNYFMTDNIIVTGTGTYVLGLGQYGSAVNSKVTNTSGTAGRYALGGGTYAYVAGNELVSTNGGALYAGGVDYVVGNYFHDSAVGHSMLTVDNVTLIFNIFDNCGIGISMSSGAVNAKISNNTFYGAESPTGTGISLVDGGGHVITNNIFYGLSTGLSFSSTLPNAYLDYNNFYNNTTNRTNNTAGAHDLALNPNFVDAPNGNFSIGTNLRARAFPGLFSGSASTGYLDIGAVQRVEGTSPGTTNVRGGVRIR